VVVALTEIGLARRERHGRKEMRRSRLLPERAAGSGCPGSITGVRLIDVSARHHERKIGVLIAQARVTRCPLRTQLGRADQPKRPLDDVLPIAEGQPVPPARSRSGACAPGSPARRSRSTQLR
jgi:hypothetical protein